MKTSEHFFSKFIRSGFRTLSLLGLLSAVASSSTYAAAPFAVSREVRSFDRGNINYQKNWKDPGSGQLQTVDVEVEYDFEVPERGWYCLYLQDMPPLAREVYVDGKRVSFMLGSSPKSAAEILDLPPKSLERKGWAKEANLSLEKGKHTLRFSRAGRMGFPLGFARKWEIRAASEALEDRVSARIDGHREHRLGESLKVIITGGVGRQAARYDLVRIDEMTGRSAVVTSVEFAPGMNFVTKTVEIPCDTEGVFRVAATAGQYALTPQEFTDGTYFVVDTKRAPDADKPSSAAAPAKTVELHDIDCIANTNNGIPVRVGENYWEANGATRINTSAVGRYRESGDGLGADAESRTQSPVRSFGGFAYLLDGFEPGQPYIIEIDHPDDDWRSVCVSIVDVFDVAAKKGLLPPSFGYETGGYLPLSQTMLTEKVMFWPNGKQIHLGLVSTRLGKRAAAAHIRVYKVEGLLPSQPTTSTGRFAGLWMEEPERWHTHFNTPANLTSSVRDYVGLKRTMEWLAYTGMNGFWPTSVAYQNAAYDSRELGGFLIKQYNVTRLSTLLCEKFGLAYVTEVFLARQRYFSDVVMAAGAEHPEDIYVTSWWGFSLGTSKSSGGVWPRWNILHPHVQAKMIAIFGELADGLGDVSSFAGLSGRIDAWQWDGVFSLTSLNWGYEDWTIGEFEKDTGIKVPGDASDSARFTARYRFLTSPEHKATWIDWRSKRLTDFLQRLSARIRQARPDATLFLCGDAKIDGNHTPSIPADMQERLVEMGIDTARLAKIPGVAIMPALEYGRGKSFTYLADQKAYDNIYNPAYLKAGMGSVRGSALYGVYQEWGTAFPLDKLGAPLARWHYCSGSSSAGRNALEPMASVLAEQDSMAFRDGGYPLVYGFRDFYADWMREFSHLPRRPFEPVALARDPIAVWQRHDDGQFLFYAVNREQYPVTITLALTGTNEVTRLGTAERITLRNSSLVLELAPYELRTFSAPTGTTIARADIKVAPEHISFLQRRLAFAREIQREMATGPFKSSFTQTEKEAYSSRLKTAEDAFAQKAYWRTRTVLNSAAMMTVYERTGRYPEGQVAAKIPGMLENLASDRFVPNEPFITADELYAQRAPASAGTLVNSEVFSRDWLAAQVVRSETGKMAFDLNVPVAGYYQLSVGCVAEQPGALSVSLDGKSLSPSGQIRTAGVPEKSVFPRVYLSAGKVHLEAEYTQGAFGLYAMKLVPKLRPLNTTCWSTVAPFPSEWGKGNDGERDADVKPAMLTPFGPETNGAAKAQFAGEGGRILRWTTTSDVVGLNEDIGVNFAQRTGLTGYGLGYAQTFITSPDDFDVIVYIGSDWWANAWLNGELLKPEGSEKLADITGVHFNGWKPRAVKIHLKKGVNRLLVKNHGGTLHCWFTCYITDHDSLTITPFAPAEISNQKKR